MGAENINLVTASHYVPVLLRVFAKYRPKIPVVYNTHSYERVEVLQALDKYIDVYLPDLKYYSPKVSLRYTGKSNYFEYASRAIGFMAQREAEFEGEKMVRGCIVRHLILPLNVRDSIALIDWFAQKKFPAYFSLMRQYTPAGRSKSSPNCSAGSPPASTKPCFPTYWNAGWNGCSCRSAAPRTRNSFRILPAAKNSFNADGKRARGAV